MKLSSRYLLSCGVLAAGNWIVDEVKLIDVFPAVEKLANIQSQSLGTGGAPYNVLLDLAKLGAEFPLSGAGMVGKDAYGEQILADCARYKIDTRLLKMTADAPTSFTDVNATSRRASSASAGLSASSASSA